MYNSKSSYDSAAKSLAKKGQSAVKSFVPLHAYSFTKQDGASLKFSDGDSPVNEQFERGQFRE